MTVFGRLGALFVVLGGAALLLVDTLRSPPGLWYAAIGIVAGTTMMAYTVISSPSPRRLQPAPEPTYPSTSNESTTASTTRQNDSQLVDTPQTAESTESADQKAGASERRRRGSSGAANIGGETGTVGEHGETSTGPPERRSRRRSEQQRTPILPRRRKQRERRLAGIDTLSPQLHQGGAHPPGPTIRISSQSTQTARSSSPRLTPDSATSTSTGDQNSSVLTQSRTSSRSMSGRVP